MAVIVTNPSNAVAGSSFQSDGGEVERDLGERGREHMSMLDFVTDARGGEARRTIILSGAFQSGANDTAAVQAAIDWALQDVTGRCLYVPGDFICQQDVIGLHDVQMYGPGLVKVGTGSRWYVSANKLNTGFSPLGYNTIYVDAINGSDSNSGMAPEFALATMQEAVDKFVGHDSGFKKIQVAKGVYRDTCNLNAIESSKAHRLYVVGPAKTWDNSSPPPEPVDISAITQANPVVITAAGHSCSINDEIMIFDAVNGSSGEHDSVGTIYTVTNVSGNDVTINASGINWAAYSSSGKLLQLTNGTPTAIFLGAKATDEYAIVQDADDYVEYTDLTFVNWGTRATTSQNAGGIRASGGNAVLTNVHSYQCYCRSTIRDFSVGVVTGGYVWKTANGDWAVGGARFTFGGDANPGTATLTTSTLYHKCIRAWDIWENCTGHCDGSIVLDCDEIGKVFGGSHVVSYYNRYTNTGASALKGWTCAALGNISRSTGATDVVTGNFADLVDRQAGGTVIYSTDTTNKIRRQKTMVYRINPNSTTANGVEQTLATFTIPKGMHNQPYDTFELYGTFVLNNPTGNVLIRTRVNGSNFYTFTIPPYATAQQSGEISVRWTRNDALNARAHVSIRVFETATGTLTYERFSNYTPAWDSQTADLPITATMVVPAGNTGQYSVIEMFSDCM